MACRCRPGQTTSLLLHRPQRVTQLHSQAKLRAKETARPYDIHHEPPLVRHEHGEHHMSHGGE